MPNNKQLAKEIAKAYKTRTFQEACKKSFEDAHGKINFQGSVEKNIENILPEILQIFQKHGLLKDEK